VAADARTARLSEVLGEQVWRESGIGGPDDTGQLGADYHNEWSTYAPLRGSPLICGGVELPTGVNPKVCLNPEHYGCPGDNP
jgi:hypothetical protein